MSSPLQLLFSHQKWSTWANSTECRAKRSKVDKNYFRRLQPNFDSTCWSFSGDNNCLHSMLIMARYWLSRCDTRRQTFHYRWERTARKQINLSESFHHHQTATFFPSLNMYAHTRWLQAMMMTTRHLTWNNIVPARDRRAMEPYEVKIIWKDWDWSKAINFVLIKSTGAAARKREANYF